MLAKLNKKTTECEINQANVLQDVTVMVDRYEAALVTNDVETLDSLFWRDECTVRYGASECLYGHDEILNFRKSRNAQGLMRTVTRRAITTYGEQFATASLEFVRDGETRVGRQSQTWVKLANGWQVVNAHVSWIDNPAAPV